MKNTIVQIMKIRIFTYNSILCLLTALYIEEDRHAWNFDKETSFFYESRAARNCYTLYDLIIFSSFAFMCARNAARDIESSIQLCVTYQSALPQNGKTYEAYGSVFATRSGLSQHERHERSEERGPGKRVRER